MLNRIDQPWPMLHDRPPFADFDLPFTSVSFEDVEIADLCASCDIDHSVGPVHHTKGGAVEGYKRWDLFKTHGLSSYHKLRNDPTVRFPKGVSRLSAYLHHGHVSPFRIAHEAAQADSPGAKKYLDELLIWRELAHNLCFYRSDLETLRILPAWARTTLQDHVQDKRPRRYTREQLERGATDDRLWNTAQQSLVIHGELHNNVRMTWGKAFLNWTSSPQEALDLMIDFNHRYALDGSDPNSYGGLLWCLGLFDRPFTPEQPVFGTVRTRPTVQHSKRIHMEKYTAHVARPPGSRRQKIAIVGAGMSGITAGLYLQNNGYEVNLYEKSRGPGGRMATRRVDDLAFDHGAQYFTARHERFRHQVNAWVEAGAVKEWTGRIGVLDQGTIDSKPSTTRRYVGTPRMSALTRHMSASLDVAYNTRISNVTYADASWTLETESGQTTEAYDGLLITVPPEQALPFLSHSPDLHDQVRAVSMRPCWAVMLVYDTPLSIPLDGAFVHNSPLSWICRNGQKPERPPHETWVLHSSPDWAEQHLEMTREQVLPLLVHAFQEAVGEDLQAASFAKAHRWRYALAQNPLSTGCLWDPAKHLAVSGDWCNSSRVEGAYLSGLAAAGRFMGIPDSLSESIPAHQLSLPGL